MLLVHEECCSSRLRWLLVREGVAGFSEPCVHRITESQKGKGWKGPLWVTQSNPLPKQGHLQQAAQDRVQAGLEYLQRRRLQRCSSPLIFLAALCWAL